jgi:hypothetical protein
VTYASMMVNRWCGGAACVGVELLAPVEFVRSDSRSASFIDQYITNKQKKAIKQTNINDAPFK